MTRLITRPEGSLFPCVDSVAVRAEQSYVSSVCRPIFKPMRPRILTIARSYFFSWVNVVYIQHAYVVIPALATFPAKIRNNLQFSFPVSVSALVNRVSVFVPKLTPAIVGAISMCAFLATRFALLFFTPPGGEVTRLLAVFTSSIFKPVSVNHERFFAVGAGCLNFRISHDQIIPQTHEPKYFEIAVERIEAAYAQMRLFA